MVVCLADSGSIKFYSQRVIGEKFLNRIYSFDNSFLSIGNQRDGQERDEKQRSLCSSQWCYQ